MIKYMKRDKREIIDMLIEANIHLELPSLNKQEYDNHTLNEYYGG